MGPFELVVPSENPCLIPRHLYRGTCTEAPVARHLLHGPRTPPREARASLPSISSLFERYFAQDATRIIHSSGWVGRNSGCRQRATDAQLGVTPPRPLSTTIANRVARGRRSRTRALALYSALGCGLTLPAASLDPRRRALVGVPETVAAHHLEGATVLRSCNRTVDPRMAVSAVDRPVLIHDIHTRAGGDLASDESEDLLGVGKIPG